MIKYLINNESARAWCIRNKVSYQKTLRLIKSGKPEDEILKILGKRYEARTIEQATSIAAKRWMTAKTREDRIAVRSWFTKQFEEHPRYSEMWDKVVNGQAKIKWLPVEGYPGYEISNNGILKKYHKDVALVLLPYRNQIWNKAKTKHRYELVVKIYGPNGPKKVKLAKIVATAFIGPTKDLYIHHIDGNYKNCRADNLELIDKHNHGKMTGYQKEKSRVIQELDANGKVIKEYRSSRTAAKALYVSYQTILDICHGRIKKEAIVNVRFKKEEANGKR